MNAKEHRTFTKNGIEYIVNRKIDIYINYVPEGVQLLSLIEGESADDDFSTLCTNFFKTHTHSIDGSSSFYIDDVNVRYKDGTHVSNLNLLFNTEGESRHSQKDFKFAHNIERSLLAGALRPIK